MELLASQGDVGANNRLLNGPKLPREAAYLWNWFYIAHREERSFGGMGDPLPLSGRKVRGALMARGHYPDNWEVDAILRVDDAWMSRPKGKRRPDPPKG